MTITLDALQGRVMDLDSHEMMPASSYEECFGERGRRFVEASDVIMKPLMESLGPNNVYVEVDDDMKITPETVWNEKGPGAPSAFDLSRRLEVLDTMGVRRQLVFPGFGFSAFILALGGRSDANSGWRLSTPEIMEVGWAAVDAHNEWAAELSSKYSDRLRMVGVLGAGKPGATPEWLVKEAERLIGTGLRALFVPAGAAPAGISPADLALDLFYATVAEADVPLTFHIGGGVGLFQTNVWGQVPAFRFQYHQAGEHSIDPYSLCHMHMAEENYLAAMTLGGVFERHPTLRVGAIEVGASWIGPLAERMDFLVDKHAHLWDGEEMLSMRPSEYLSRNVRVTPYHHEPMEVWLERYPMIQDVYCYSTDYPHLEGGRRSLQREFDRIAPLGDAITEKYFCSNGELLLP